MKNGTAKRYTLLIFIAMVIFRAQRIHSTIRFIKSNNSRKYERYC